jgi:hypothetical protein
MAPRRTRQRYAQVYLHWVVMYDGVQVPKPMIQTKMRMSCYFRLQCVSDLHACVVSHCAFVLNATCRVKLLYDRLIHTFSCQ